MIESKSTTNASETNGVAPATEKKEHLGLLDSLREFMKLPSEDRVQLLKSLTPQDREELRIDIDHSKRLPDGSWEWVDLEPPRVVSPFEKAVNVDMKWF